MRHQPTLCLLLGLSLAAGSALYTYARNSARFQSRSMQLIMKDLGHNLWFFSAAGTPFQVTSAVPDLPAFADDRVHSLSGDRTVASTYWCNILQATVPLRGRTVLLTGFEALDDHQVTDEKAHLLEPLPPGYAALGRTLAQAWKLEEGDVLSLGERDYTVRWVHPSRGALEDERLWLPLADVQTWLGRPGEANLILGFLCMQGRSLEDGLARLQARLAERHADLQALPLMNILKARELARLTTSRYLDVLLAAIAAVVMLLMAGVGWLEVNERRHELAMLLAMGAGYRFLALFFLTKAAVLTVTAATAGFLLGSFCSIRWLSPVLVTQSQPMQVLWSDLPHVIGLALALVAAASLMPMARLVRLDPVRILAEES